MNVKQIKNKVWKVSPWKFSLVFKSLDSPNFLSSLQNTRAPNNSICNLQTGNIFIIIYIYKEFKQGLTVHNKRNSN